VSVQTESLTNPESLIFTFSIGARVTL